MTRGQKRIRDLGIPGYEVEEVAFMEETLLRHRPEFIGEWGTNRGSSARIFYELALLHDIPTKIHTVELPPEKAHLGAEHPGERVGEFIRGLPIVMHEGDGAPVCIDWCAQSQADRPLFFIDGDHTTRNVFRELRLLYTNVPEAVLLLHDTNGPPGDAVAGFFDAIPRKYDCDVLISGAGMTKLTPYAQN